MAPPITDVLARNVRAERSRLRWRQADLADALGWSATTVADVEGGRRRLDIGQIAALCRALDVPLAQLLHGADPSDLAALGLA